ncbi:siderophore ABC transporter substrate-binding protein [Shouchella shacheensis]|uniref:siderophore ABC transporter substrate-binding protein n=1 Tax=Shouchella shacheensis TaxID=1649580 RepID=UPI00073FEAB5|nr:siderophore ABC transporter substrate-binding protein [Shouchella shacheensis]
MKKHMLWMMTALSVTGLAACGGDTNTGAAEEDTSSNEDASQETMTVEHELGETEVPVNPDSVVSFDNGLTDSVRALDGNITGIPKANNVPEYLSDFESDEYEDVGSLFEPNFELINEMQPDVIFISGRASDSYEELSEIAPTVYMAVDNENYMESFEENMHTLGEIFGAEDEVEAQLSEIHAVIDDVRERAENSDENGLIISADEGAVSAYGAGSRFGLIHDVLGITPADDIDSQTHGETVSFEYIAETNPGYLFVLDRGATIGDEASSDQILDNELVDRTDAAQNENIVHMNGDYWYLSGGGLESVRYMVEEIDEGFEG